MKIYTIPVIVDVGDVLSWKILSWLIILLFSQNYKSVCSMFYINLLAWNYESVCKEDIVSVNIHVHFIYHKLFVISEIKNK